jgi:mannose-6-phosphate isomerase-like protein (cupin superfamily)
MKLLAGGVEVHAPNDGRVSTLGNCTSRTVIAQRIAQTISTYTTGISGSSLKPATEEVLYVVAGEGLCHLDGSAYPIRPGDGIFVPPGSVSSIENPGPAPLLIVSVAYGLDPRQRPAGAPPGRTVHESERPSIRASKDREFRLLVTTDMGSQQITQFVGWIAPSKAPFHHHTYEEGIYILDGHGILHLKDQPSASEFGPGTSIYLPAGVVHCLENPGTVPIRLLGVFHPSGSPAAAYEDD